jgi:hypothetical protein
MILNAVAEDLNQIRHEDGLTLVDIGRVLGKSDDQAGKYCTASADMGLASYAFGKAAWNGRFGGSLNRLISDHRGDDTSDREKGSAVLRAALALSIALEDDDAIDEREVRTNRADIEAAIDALTGLLRKLTPREVRA